MVAALIAWAATLPLLAARAEDAADAPPWPGPRVFRDFFRHQAVRFERWAAPGYVEGLLSGARIAGVEIYPASSTGAPKMLYTERREMRDVAFEDFLAYLASDANRVNPAYVADCEIATVEGLPADTCMAGSATRALLEDLGAATVPQIEGLGASGGEAAVRLFVGNGSTTQYHFDSLHDALIVQVHGRKRLVVAPPNATAAIGLAVESGACRFGVGTEVGRGSAWSARFAAFAPGAFVVDLAPGDAALVPRFWWHAVYGDRVPPETAPSLTLSYFHASPLANGAPPPPADEIPDDADGFVYLEDIPEADPLMVDCLLRFAAMRAPRSSDAEIEAARRPDTFGDRTVPRRRRGSRRDPDRRFRRGRTRLLR